MFGIENFYLRVRDSIRRNRYLRRIRASAEQLWCYERIVILRKIISVPPDQPGFELVEHAEYDRTVAETYRRRSDSLTEVHLKSRYSRGLRFYELEREKETLATTWIVPPGHRFIDEVGYHFPIDERALWIRDIYVVPHARGRRIFSIFLDVLLHRIFPGTRVLWSDAGSKDIASIRAHLYYGFEVIETITMLHLAGAFMFRLKGPAQRRCLPGFKAKNRVLYTGRPYRKYKDDYLA